jgi:hypothetical protein
MRLVTNSRLVGALDTGLARIETAWANSAVRRTAASVVNTAFAGDPARAVAATGIVVSVAMIVHIVLELFATPYPFPSRAHLILPACVLAIGVLILIARNAVARAWQNRSR